MHCMARSRKLQVISGTPTCGNWHDNGTMHAYHGQA